MDWKKLSPWNWLKKEQSESHQVPVVQQPATAQNDINPLTVLHRDIDRLFEQVWQRFGLTPALGRPLSDRHQDVIATFHPQLEISESDNHYRIQIDVPGVNRADLVVALDGDTLIVRGEKQEVRQHQDECCQYSERRYGSFQRVLALPADADSDALRARFDDGVLTISIPRLAGKGTARQIAIEDPT